jgi:hypothetical protein
MVLSNWTIGAFLQYASGFPLVVPSAQTALNNILFQGTSFANRVPGKPLFTVDTNCHCYDPNKTFVLNKDAWVDPQPDSSAVPPLTTATTVRSAGRWKPELRPNV